MNMLSRLAFVIVFSALFVVGVDVENENADYPSHGQLKKEITDDGGELKRVSYQIPSLILEKYLVRLSSNVLSVMTVSYFRFATYLLE